MDVHISLNGESILMKTKDGKVSFISKVVSPKYNIRVETLSTVFEEEIELQENEGIYYLNLKNAWDGYVLGESGVYPILSDGSVFTSEKHLKALPRGFEDMKLILNDYINEFEPKPLMEGVFHRKRIVVSHNNFPSVAFEMYNKLWYLGADVKLVNDGSTMDIVKTAIEFGSDVVLHIVRGDNIVFFYEYDEQGKKLSELIARSLKTFAIPHSDHILIQPFGSRVIISLKDYDRKTIWNVITALKEFFKT